MTIGVCTVNLEGDCATIPDALEAMRQLLALAATAPPTAGTTGSSFGFAPRPDVPQQRIYA